MRRSDSRRMAPATSQHKAAGPVWRRAQRGLPSPSSSRVVTVMICVLLTRPPGLSLPVVILAVVATDWPPAKTAHIRATDATIRFTRLMEILPDDSRAMWLRYTRRPPTRRRQQLFKAID